MICISHVDPPLPPLLSKIGQYSSDAVNSFFYYEANEAGGHMVVVERSVHCKSILSN